MAFDWRGATGVYIAIGDGHIPTVRMFRRLRRSVWVGLQPIHSNPRFYKYYWRIFTAENAVPDEDVLDLKAKYGPRPWRVFAAELCFVRAMERMQALYARDELFLAYTVPMKRLDPVAPWDMPRLRASGTRVAVAYDVDSDPPFHDHK